MKKQLGHKKIESTIHYYTQVSPEVEEQSRQIIQGISVKPMIEGYEEDLAIEQSGKKLENQPKYTFVNGKLKTK